MAILFLSMLFSSTPCWDTVFVQVLWNFRRNLEWSESIEPFCSTLPVGAARTTQFSACFLQCKHVPDCSLFLFSKHIHINVSFLCACASGWAPTCLCCCPEHMSGGTPCSERCFCWQEHIQGNRTTLSSQSRALKQNWVLSPTTRTTEPPDDRTRHWLTESNTIRPKKKKKQEETDFYFIFFPIWCESTYLEVGWMTLSGAPVKQFSPGQPIRGQRNADIIVG